MNTNVADQLKTLLCIHGNDFWESLFALMNRIGFCGECGRPGRLCNVASLHFGVCDVCRTVWYLSANVFGWQNEGQQVSIANQDLLAMYRSVNAQWPCILMHGGSMETLAGLDAFLEGAVEVKLQEPAERQRFIDRIAEIEVESEKGK